MRIEHGHKRFPLVAFVDDIEDVASIATKTVEARDRQFVPWPQEFDDRHRIGSVHPTRLPPEAAKALKNGTATGLFVHDFTQELAPDVRNLIDEAIATGMVQKIPRGRAGLITVAGGFGREGFAAFADAQR